MSDTDTVQCTITELKQGERLDDTGFGGIRVIQKKDFGYGVDSVLLAAFAAGETGAGRVSAVSGGRKGPVIADLGTGNGIIAFIVAHKLKDSVITGIEKNPAAWDRAVRACRLNGLEDRISFENQDILDIAGRHDYDAVLSNPPYFRRDPHIESAETAQERGFESDRYISRHETTADFGDFAAAAASMLIKGGSFSLIHRPERLADIITAMRAADIEPKFLQMVVPTPGGEASMVMIKGIRGGRPALKVLPELAVHQSGGGYTEDILRIYERLQ